MVINWVQSNTLCLLAKKNCSAELDYSDISLMYSGPYLGGGQGGQPPPPPLMYLTYYKNSETNLQNYWAFKLGLDVKSNIIIMYMCE